MSYIKKVTAFILNLRQQQQEQADQIERLYENPFMHLHTCRDKSIDGGTWQRSGLILPDAPPSTLAIRL
jgi:hypothetical protein